MATWGVYPFENSAALEWFYELFAAPDLVFLIKPFLSLGVNPRSTAAPCEEVLAAAEIIAALLDAPSAHLPAEIRAWVQEVPLPHVNTFAPMALGAVQHILDHSWLKDQWSEGDHLATWCAAVLDLETRLTDIVHEKVKAEPAYV